MAVECSSVITRSQVPTPAQRTIHTSKCQQELAPYIWHATRTVQRDWPERVVLVQETVLNLHQIFRASLWFLESLSRALITSTGLDWIEQCFMPPPTQYRLYEGTVFIGQKTQPTVSKYWRKIYKGKQPREQRKHKIHISIHTQNSRKIQHTSITQQVPTIIWGEPGN